LHDASARVSVADDSLRIQDFAATLGAGSVSGSLLADAASDPPSLSVQAKVNNAAIAGPLGDLVIDLQSGRADAEMRLDARGYSPSAILATLEGRVTLTVSDGMVSGFDLPRLKLAVESTDPKAAEAGANDALRSGASGFDRLELAAGIANGALTLDRGSLTSTAGNAHVTGSMNLANRLIDASIVLTPALPSPPQVTLHLSGPIARPNRTPELAGLARWMAELMR
jgi:uncharacterized protein involved in outer membrane biogenesis